MATINKTGVGVAHTVSGNSPQVSHVEEGTPTWSSNLGSGALGKSSTGYFKKGAMLYLNSTRGLEVVPGNGIATAYTARVKRIVGFAAEDGTGVTTHKVPILVANADTVFYSNVGSRTSVATATVSRALIGSAAAASLNSSRFYVNTTSSAGNSVVRVISLHPEDAIGDTYGRVLFQVLPANSLWR